jgi:hypothetical protein
MKRRRVDDVILFLNLYVLVSWDEQRHLIPENREV